MGDKIVPKIDAAKGIESIKSIEKNAGKFDHYEFQMIPNGENIYGVKYFRTELDAIGNVISDFPYIKEITIHVPVNNFEIEHIVLRNIDMVYKYISLVDIFQKKYNVKPNILFHVDLNYKNFITNLDARIKNILRFAKNRNINIIFENTVMNEDSAPDSCAAVIQIVKHYREKGFTNLYLCIDTCHVAIKAHMFKKSREEYYKTFFNINYGKENIDDMVYQVHFSDATNHDGYIDISTHSRIHSTEEKMKRDIDLLNSVGIHNIRFVTEIIEDDYYKRPEQIEEINNLKKYCL